MTFADIPLGAAVFLDANILVYHFTPHPVLGQACTDLLERARRLELTTFTSAAALADVAHRLMTSDASATHGQPMTGIVRWLKRHPASVRTLNRPRQVLLDIPSYNMQVLPVTKALIEDATLVSQQTGLLTNDGLVVAVMRQHGLDALASHDADFDRVPGLTRYAPV
jgi:predicted nucleic acid-binding protein